MIISRHKYECMKNDLHLAKLVIKLKNGKIDSQQEIIQRLIKENEAIRSLIVNKDIDFPATEKLHEDKLF